LVDQMIQKTVPHLIEQMKRSAPADLCDDEKTAVSMPVALSSDIDSFHLTQIAH
jgi:hypothetical protein